ncbi:hypothetical protein S83_066753 [Arachis hypogaea]|uniref:Remorin C-terminal domain-containing protein n=1 Tax=Arachis hypogaea TaxID=3818 RepID=A0A444XPM5_ARAHY|nr:hypothetical protein Ahy_B09g097600 [Arachis hypogaea]
MESNNNNSSSSMKLGSFLIPDMQNHSERSIGSQKGWNSERVVLNQTSRIRRHSGLTSFNSGRRTMPSKWDDAERWICSPVSGYGSSSNNNRNSYSRSQLQRHPKSKSGPIMPPGTSSSSYYSNYSPTIPLRQGLLVRNLMVGSSFTTGVLAPDALSLHHFDAHDNDFGHRFDIGNVMQPCSTGAVLNDNNGVLAPMWNQLLCDPSSPNSQDENPKNEENRIMSPFSRRDHGTQMSPPENEDDANSSPTSAMDQKNGHSGKLEVRDVEVDSEATVIRWPKGHATKLTSFQESNSEIQTSCSDIAKSTMDITKIQKEEAKIVAWESQQKAKAEATIRKLEMKLEKKRSSSMDKILNKLRRAQMKAEKMRSSIAMPQKQEQGQQGKQNSKLLKWFKPKHRSLHHLHLCPESPFYQEYPSIKIPSFILLISLSG